MGDDVMNTIQSTKVALFGLGGVGSWCAEALVRSGIGHLMIVDSDRICLTNVNRQLQATFQNIGCSKVDELALRLRAINPAVKLECVEKFYDYQSRNEFPLEQYDYVIDAIDSLSAKVELILHASDAGAKLFSAMGAACRLDPALIKTGSIWGTQGCGLSRVVRKKLRKKNYKGDFICVFSEETLENKGSAGAYDSNESPEPKEGAENSESNEAHELSSSKKQVNGSLVHMTGIFGFTLAGLVIQDVVKVMAG